MAEYKYRGMLRNGKLVRGIMQAKNRHEVMNKLKNTRIQHATFLMEQGITSVKNVAFLSGYKDSLYFSNVFKKTVGTAPSEFIKGIGQK